MNTDAPVSISSPAPTADRITRGPVYCVVNAGSGRESGEDKAERLRAEFQRSGRPGEILVATPGHDVIALAERAVERADREGGIVIVAGGDGTVSAVARVAVPLSVPMGVIPEGTFNLLARAHGIPENQPEAISVAFNGRAVPVQVGRVNELLFLVNASVGLYPKLLADREVLKSLLGRSRFVALIAGFRTLFGQFRPLVLDVDLNGRRRRMKTTTLFIGNNRLQLERLGLPEADASERGRLVLLNARPFGHLTALRLMFQAAIGRLGSSSDFEVTTFRELEACRPLRPGGRRRPLGVAIDGERFRVEPPVRFAVYPQPLWLIVPHVVETDSAPSPTDPSLAVPSPANLSPPPSPLLPDPALPDRPLSGPPLTASSPAAASAAAASATASPVPPPIDLPASAGHSTA